MERAEKARVDCLHPVDSRYDGRIFSCDQRRDRRNANPELSRYAMNGTSAINANTSNFVYVVLPLSLMTLDACSCRSDTIRIPTNSDRCRAIPAFTPATMIGMQDGDLTLEVEINGEVVCFGKSENIKNTKTFCKQPRFHLSANVRSYVTTGSRVSLNLFTFFFRSRDFIEIEMLRTATAYDESVVA